MLALAFLAVGREGVETALFMVGYAEAQTAWPLIGLIIGVLVAAAIAYGMYAGAHAHQPRQVLLIHRRAS